MNKTAATSPLRVIPLGGLGEIGMNCMILEYEDEIIVVDCGLIFSDLDHFGVEYGIPDFSYLKERQDKISAFVITHGHEDHTGALPFALKAGLNAPIYASAFTSMLLGEKLKEHGLTESTEVRVFKMGDSIQFRNFTVKTVSVNHSIVDSAALIIDTPHGKIIHTGDFKMDPTPFFGSEIDMPTFQKAGQEGVLLLMSDSTNVERHEHSMSENVIYQAFERLFAAAEGLTVVSMFASNVGRMGQVFDLAKKLNKKIALAGRSMEQNVRLGAEAGYLKGTESIVIPTEDIDQYDRNRVIVLSTGSQGEYRSALIRIANGEHGQIQLEKGDLVVMSSKFIPGNEKAIGRMINNLFKQGAEVLYESVHDIHVSGHATKPELKKMLEATKPRFFVPIHGEYRHLVHHAKLAEESGVKSDHVVIATDGDILELTENSLEIVDRMEETRILVEGHEGNDVTKLVLKERRQIGETGIVFCLLVRNSDSRAILSDPEIITKGLAPESEEVRLVLEARDVAKRIVGRYEAEIRSGRPQMDLQETLRIELRRYFHSQIGKKPVVLPMVLDL